MKALLFIPALVLYSYNSCNHKHENATVLTGKLEIKAMCMNYTISVMRGNLDTSMIVNDWTDQNTGKKYHNVFRLGNPCDFPEKIQEGDLFEFTIGPKERNCAVCMVYYPTPSKSLNIKVSIP
jgi:hypothetical protein